MVSSLARIFPDVYVVYVPVLFAHKCNYIVCGFFCKSYQFIMNLIQVDFFDSFLELFPEGPVQVGMDTLKVLSLVISLLNPVYLILWKLKYKLYCWVSRFFGSS